MDFLEVSEIVSVVSYKPGWCFEVILLSGGISLRVMFVVGGVKQKGRWWRISAHSTRNEVVNTCMLAVLTAEEHEIRETFRYKGTLIYNPHIDVDWLAENVRKVENLDVRPPL